MKFSFIILSLIIVLTLGVNFNPFLFKVFQAHGAVTAEGNKQQCVSRTFVDLSISSF
jgi:hypothetical protein